MSIQLAQPAQDQVPGSGKAATGKNMAQNSIYSLIEKAKQQQGVLSPNLIQKTTKLDEAKDAQFSFANNLSNLNRKMEVHQPKAKRPFLQLKPVQALEAEVSLEL